MSDGFVSISIKNPTRPNDAPVIRVPLSGSTILDVKRILQQVIHTALCLFLACTPL